MGMSILAASATAGDEKNEVSGIVGRTLISDQALHGQTLPPSSLIVRSGKGLTFEVNYLRSVVPRSMPSRWKCLLFSMLMRTSTPVAISFPHDYEPILVTPAVGLTRFPGTRGFTWMSFGGGFGHFSENNKRNYFGTDPGGSLTGGVIQAGLGLDVSPFQKDFSHFSFRGEVRDFYFRYS